MILGYIILATLGCGMCATGCGRKVYGFDYEREKSVVIRPNNCMVACVTCANTCLKGAISFPPVEYVRELGSMSLQGRDRRAATVWEKWRR